MTGFTIRVRGGGGLIAREYACPDHGVFDLLVERNHATEREARPCPTCGAPSEMAMSAPIGRVRLGEVGRGKSDPPPSPIALDTRALADGMPLHEWKQRRRAMWNDHDRRKWKEKTG